jgi:biopolymer transport protein ExbB/TolQ
MTNTSVDTTLQSVEMLLYSISTFLYLPVLLAIVGLAFYLLVCFGALIAEWRQRRRGIRILIANAEADMAAALASTCNATALDAQLERIVQKADSEGLRRLDKVRFMVRVGPALGLMGTLIPMGISLAGLAQGNLPQMAQSMTTAFTATVVGLGCGVGSYLIALAREHWLRNDMTDVAYAAESFLARHGKHAAKNAAEAGG